MAAKWYYSHDGARKGPVESQQLIELAKSGQLLPEDLLWKEGMVDWKPAGEAKKLFGRLSDIRATTPSIDTDPVANAPNTDVEQAVGLSPHDDLMRSVGASVPIAAIGAVALHALQWLFGWGWGSLWAVGSTVVIVSCGILPWMRNYEGHRSPSAAFGAGVGAVLGVAYGWFTGGLLSGVLFCTSIGTWAAWLGNIRGLTSKAAQAAIVACTLTGFHVLGMLPPSGRVEAGRLDRPISDQEFEGIQIGTRKWTVQDTIGPPFSHDVDLQEEKVFGSRGEIFGSQFNHTVTYAYRLKKHPDKLAMFVFQGTQAIDGSNPKLVEKAIVPRPREN